jgi:RNA polymerase sigma-70 factor (ECF subfamily)
MNPRTDAEVVQAVLGGDKNSYALLVDSYSERVVNYLARMTGNRWEAEELAQEAFIRAYLALRSFDPQFRFSTWLFKIATNLCINYLKGRKRLVYVDDYEDEDGNPLWVISDGHPESNPVFVVEQRELQRQIQEAINQLPAAYRTVVILRHIQGMSYEEISKVTNLPMGTVKSRLGRGRCRLTTLLQDKI